MLPSASDLACAIAWRRARSLEIALLAASFAGSRRAWVATQIWGPYLMPSLTVWVTSLPLPAMVVTPHSAPGGPGLSPGPRAPWPDVRADLLGPTLVWGHGQLFSRLRPGGRRCRASRRLLRRRSRRVRRRGLAVPAGPVLGRCRRRGGGGPRGRARTRGPLGRDRR